jgi:hypothetical protein
MSRATPYSRGQLRPELGKNGMPAWVNGTTGNQFGALSDLIPRRLGVGNWNTGFPDGHYLDYGIAQPIFDVWQSGYTTLEQTRRHWVTLQHLVESDRGLSQQPSLRQHFVATFMGRILSMEHLPHPPQGLQTFAEWVYERP